MMDCLQVQVKGNQPHFLSEGEPDWPAVLNDLPVTLDWKTLIDGDRGKNKTTSERTEGQKRKACLPCYAHCCFIVWQFQSLRLRRSHFPLASSTILVLILSFSVCQFVKAPHHYCQKSHCSTNTKDTHTHITLHILAHTLVLAAHLSVKREQLFSSPAAFWHSAASLSRWNLKWDRQAVWT